MNCHPVRRGLCGAQDLNQGFLAIPNRREKGTALQFGRTELLSSFSLHGVVGDVQPRLVPVGRILVQHALGDGLIDR